MLHSKREDPTLRVFESRVLRKIYGPKEEEVTGDWRKLRNEVLPDLYCSIDISSPSRHGPTPPSSGPGPPHSRGFLITLSGTPLYEWSARRRDLYLTTNNNDCRQTSMSSAGFEPAISASERLQTDALDRAAAARLSLRCINQGGCDERSM